MRTKSSIYLIVFCLTVISINGQVPARSKTKIVFNPPDWILGQWTNLAESQTDRMESFDFSEHEILLTAGVLGKTVKFSTLYKKQEVKESFAPDIYRVQIGAGEDETIYEFRLCRSDRCDSSLREALTYSLIRNKKVVREHSTTINSVLIKRQRI